jgi:hypothetical protein
VVPQTGPSLVGTRVPGVHAGGAALVAAVPGSAVAPLVSATTRPAVTAVTATGITARASRLLRRADLP